MVELDGRTLGIQDELILVADYFEIGGIQEDI